MDKGVCVQGLVRMDLPPGQCGGCVEAEEAGSPGALCPAVMPGCKGTVPSCCLLLSEGCSGTAGWQCPSIGLCWIISCNSGLQV